MAPTPRSHHTQDEAGYHSLAVDTRTRGRRYFHVEDTIKDHKAHDLTSFLTGVDEHLPNAFCKDTTQRNKDDYCGLSSTELAKRYNHNVREGQGRRHICHGMSKCQAVRTPTSSAASLASEPYSEASAMLHLGHRDHVKDERWKEMLEEDLKHEAEPTGGATSHHLARYGRLGKGKRHFSADCKWAGYHRARRIDDPGGPTVFDKKGGGFLGASKRNFHGEGEVDAAQTDHWLSDEKMDKHSKKHFRDHFEDIVHGTEEIPLGVSRQIDLDSKGFLGKSKGHQRGSDCEIRHSSDPISDMSHKERDTTNTKDLACYGLGHRGKRKFLVQNNLDAGCRHNMARPEGKVGQTFRNASMPILERDLPPNQTPYFQDDLHDSLRAVKEERPLSSNQKPRAPKSEIDNSWSCLAWTPRKVSAKDAAAFIEGQDMYYKISDDEHRETECRASFGVAKRTFGNCHNKSSFRFDYNDDPGLQMEHVTDYGLKWGAGHGRKKILEKDHLDKDTDGVEAYQSQCGAVLCRVSRRQHEDHITSDGSVNDTRTCIFMNPNTGAVFPPRNHIVMKDNVEELFMDADVKSETSSHMAVTGVRRKNELLRPQSARRFPQKDHERVTPRSVTPRPRSVGGPLGDRPLWSK